jgi:hypothetical protein
LLFYFSEIRSGTTIDLKKEGRSHFKQIQKIGEYNVSPQGLIKEAGLSLRPDTLSPFINNTQ